MEFLAAKALSQKARQTILIVDDEEIARVNMGHVLEKEGFFCRYASNGLMALEVLALEEIDLVISDLKKDQMDGHELLRFINRDYSGAPMVVVLVIRFRAAHRHCHWACLERNRWRDLSACKSLPCRDQTVSS